MNPLTQIKSRIQLRRQEVLNGIPESASYHSQYRNSAYIYAGQLSFKLTEGDVLAIFSQYGEVVDVNLVRHKDTHESRGFAFIAYDDQRSTDLAVDNLNGAVVAGRTIAVDHVLDYKRLVEQDEDIAEPGLPPPPSRLPARDVQEGAILAGAEAEDAEDEYGVMTEPEAGSGAHARRSPAPGHPPQAAEPWAGRGSIAEMLRNAENMLKADAPRARGAQSNDGGRREAASAPSARDRPTGRLDERDRQHVVPRAEAKGRDEARGTAARQGNRGRESTDEGRKRPSATDWDEEEDPLVAMRKRSKHTHQDKEHRKEKKAKKEMRDKPDRKDKRERSDAVGSPRRRDVGNSGRSRDGATDRGSGGKSRGGSEPGFASNSLG